MAAKTRVEDFSEVWCNLMKRLRLCSMRWDKASIWVLLFLFLFFCFFFLFGLLKLFGTDAHRVWDNATKTELTIRTPVDLEGHRGFDNRFYLVDTSRLMPPCVLDMSDKSRIFFELFRPGSSSGFFLEVFSLIIFYF